MNRRTAVAKLAALASGALLLCTCSAPPEARVVPLRGINLAGAEFGHEKPGFSCATPGVYGKDWTYPGESTVAYFAPSGYALFSGIAEWKHWLNEDYFIGANDFWYSVGLRASVDDQSETFQEFWLGVHYDFTRWARFEVRTQALSSSVLDTSATTALFHLHWP